MSNSVETNDMEKEILSYYKGHIIVIKNVGFRGTGRDITEVYHMTIFLLC